MIHLSSEQEESYYTLCGKSLKDLPSQIQYNWNPKFCTCMECLHVYRARLQEKIDYYTDYINSLEDQKPIVDSQIMKINLGVKDDQRTKTK